MTIINIKNLNPVNAWNIFVNDTIEMFISQFNSEGITDITTMCQKYILDIPKIYPSFYTTKQLNYIAELLEQHINNIEYNSNRLYSVKELDDLENKIIENIKQNLKE